MQRLQPKQQLDRRRIVGIIGLTACGYYLPMIIRAVASWRLQVRVMSAGAQSM
jgi:adiponectin receptor